MANSPNPDDKVAEKSETISITDQDGNVKESFEVVNVRNGDEIQPGSFVIEVREVKQ